MGQSRFKGANNAKISEKGTKLSNGRHLCKITRITMSEDGKNGDYYVVELEVVESDSANDASGRQIDAPGAARTWTQSMDKKSYPLGKLNAFAYAAMGLDHKHPQDAAKIEKEIKNEMEDVLDNTLDESDPLGFKGRLVWADVKWEKTAKGFDFAVYTFSPGQKDKLPIAA